MLLFTFVLASLALITALDYLTGYDLSFFVFYFIPISLAAWYLGRRVGICSALLSSAAWSGAAQLSGTPFPSKFHALWDCAVRLVAFLTVAISMARLGSEVRFLRRFLPVCSWCKKVRDDGGDWEQMDTYFHRHLQARFTHGICPDCAERFHRPNVLFIDPVLNHFATLKDTFAKAGLPHMLYWTGNKQKAMQWLLGSSDYEDRTKYPMPDVVIIDGLDVEKDSLELLASIRSMAELKQLPVLIAGLEENNQLRRAYDFDALLCFFKSSAYEDLANFLKATYG